MFCFLILRDHVADPDLSDAGYFHIDGPKLTSETVLALHLDCLHQGLPFRITDPQGRVCYEGRLSAGATAENLASVCRWASVEVPQPRLILDEALARAA